MIPPISKTTQPAKNQMFKAIWRTYRSRSKAGMVNALFFRYQINRDEGSKLVESWISQGVIIPTSTKDNHYELNHDSKTK